MKLSCCVLFVLFCCQILLAAETPPEVLFPDHHLVLEATGKVILKADKAAFSYSVTGYGASLREAVTKARQRVAEISMSLNQLGISNDCFATGSFSSGKNLRSLLFSDKKDYSATLYTTITLTDLTKLDDAVLVLVDKKVDYMSDINYSMGNQAQARQQSREIALNRICEQRDTISRILGVDISDVILIDEAPFDQLPWNKGYGYNPSFSGLSNTVTTDKSFRNTPLEESVNMDNAGGMYTPDLTVETQVRVVYKIRLKPETANK